MEIYVDPALEPKAGDDKNNDDARGEDPDADPNAPTTDSAAGEGPTFTDSSSLRPPDTPSSTSPAEAFKNTLEGMPGESGETGEGARKTGGCEGGTRAVGESWKRGCNTCICEPSGEIACTLMACISYPE